MKILHVVPTYLPATRYGGPIHSIHGLCSALVRGGHDVHVATTNVDGPGESDVPLHEPVLLDGVCVRYSSSGFGRRLYYSRAMGRFLRSTASAYAVLHLHSVFLWPTLAAAGVGAPLRFVFVGNAGHRKAFDVLLESAMRLERDGVRFRLVVIGDVDAGAAPVVELRGKLRQRAIAAEIAQADCLVLPSRCDAFGMVVTEALGCGLPAIVSEHVGAKDIVAASGAGWIVKAADAGALAERMRRCIEHPEEVLEAKRKARAAAADWTWERYRERVADAVLGPLAEGGPPHG